MKKTRVLLIFGGQSGEHEVSVLSAQSVLQALDRSKYEIESIGITKDGVWYWGVDPIDWKSQPGLIKPQHKQVTLLLDPKKPRFVSLDGSELSNQGEFDIVFPVMHGPKGEDGSIQGLFEMAGVAYVGSGVLGSALGMDKDRMKAVFREAGLPIVKHITLLRSELVDMSNILNKVIDSIGLPCFVKPANLGSSVGISKASTEEELMTALSHAALYDNKLLVEGAVVAREIELSVLGNEIIQVSLPGEIIAAKDFYDYEAKYISNSSQLIIPAVLKQKTIMKLQDYAKLAFLAVGGFGLSRVDFFITPEEENIYINEINTMPGFTKISMYPKLWEASGLNYSNLIDQLINLGLEKSLDKKKNQLR